MNTALVLANIWLVGSILCVHALESTMMLGLALMYSVHWVYLRVQEGHRK